MSTAVCYWFRQDLRLHDNPALVQAIAHATRQGVPLLLLYLHHPRQDATTAWGFVRMGQYRRQFLAAHLHDLSEQLAAVGQTLTVRVGEPLHVLTDVAQQLGITPQQIQVYCEEIAAPEEQDDIQQLKRAGITVQTLWQSSLFDPHDLPFDISKLPDVFSNCRNNIERANLRPRPICATPQQWPIAVKLAPQSMDSIDVLLGVDPQVRPDARSAFDYQQSLCHGGERAALAYLQAYFASNKASHYKQTRNGLMGLDYSTKFSPWLAHGALSVRVIEQARQAYEAQHGANDSTYWIWFELLWRDYFRFLHLKYGRQLYLPRGLADMPLVAHRSKVFARWCAGQTGQAWIDAGMRELAATGYLSNRMRQNVASFWIHDLHGDWLSAAAWFEAHLLDYDVYSNQGNWLYLAGRGTDPRGSRRFNPDKQAQDYDADGAYRALWGQA